MIHVAVVGCGAAFRELHLPWLKVLEKQRQLKVVALIDSDPTRVRVLCNEFEAAESFATQEEASKRGAVQLTLVASPPSFHREHCVEALRRGSHVLCEKPLSTTAADAAEMAAASKEAGRLLAVGMSRRFFPSVAEAAELIQSGRLGEGLEFVCREGGGYGWPVATDAPFRRERSGGGVLIDRGVHVLDTLQALLGEPTLEAAYDDSLIGGVEANSIVWLRCGKVRGSVQLSWENSYLNGLFVRGCSATLRLDTGDHLHYWLRSNSGNWEKIRARVRWANGVDKKCGISLPESYESCIYFEIVQVLRAIRFGEKYPVLASDAIKVIEVIEEAYRIARPFEAKWLDKTERDERLNRHWRVAK